MNADDLGRRLGAALAAPQELRAREDAGARLRARARTAQEGRRRSLASAAAVVLVLGGIFGFLVPRELGGPDTGDQPAAAVRLGGGALTVPLEIRPVRSSVPGECRLVPVPSGLLALDYPGSCLLVGPPAFVIAEVADLDLASDASVPSVVFELRPALAAAFGDFTARSVGTRTAFLVGGTPYGDAPEIAGRIEGRFEIKVGDRAEAEELVRALRP